MSINLSFINYVLLFLIAIYVIQGIHKGFLMSLSATAGMGVSWLVASAVTPMLSAQIAKGSTYSFLLYMTDIPDSIPVELARTPVQSLSQSQIKDVVSQANFPTPFGDSLYANMTHQTFAQLKDVSTVADYLNHTIANITVNIISFLIIYILARVIITLIISSLYYAQPFPVLKNFDGLVGGVLGGIRGFCAMFAVVMILPVIIQFVSLSEFTYSINQSVLLTFFYKMNFLYGFISGTV
jgi:Colicin V production protein.